MESVARKEIFLTRDVPVKICKSLLLALDLLFKQVVSLKVKPFF